MKTIYIADDGTQFNNRFDCEKYEKELFIKSVTIEAIDKDGRLLNDLTDVEQFNRCQKIIIKNRNEIDQIERINKWCGGYEDINRVGVWEWNEGKSAWVKISEYTQ